MYLTICILLVFIGFALIIAAIINQDCNGSEEYVVDTIIGQYPGGMTYKREIKDVYEFVHPMTVVLASTGIVLLIASLVINYLV